jgi:RNA polymerase sigma-70 factor, ECF subfamily
MNSGFANEQELIARMLRGDETAFRSFFGAYFPRLYRFALPRLANDDEAAKEVVQGTLTRAMRTLAGYRGEAALFTWLCQICRRQIVDYVRLNRRHTRNIVQFEDSADLRAVLEAVEAPATDEPAHGYTVAEIRLLIQSVLDRLPSRYGDVLEWKYIQGRSVEEIGELLGIGHTAAQSMLARARTAFREALETVFGSTARDILGDMRALD